MIWFALCKWLAFFMVKSYLVCLLSTGCAQISLLWQQQVRDKDSNKKKRCPSRVWVSFRFEGGKPCVHIVGDGLPTSASTEMMTPKLWIPSPLGLVVHCSSVHGSYSVIHLQIGGLQCSCEECSSRLRGFLWGSQCILSLRYGGQQATASPGR